MLMRALIMGLLVQLAACGGRSEEPNPPGELLKFSANDQRKMRRLQSTLRTDNPIRIKGVIKNPIQRQPGGPLRFQRTFEIDVVGPAPPGYPKQFKLKTEVSGFALMVWDDLTEVTLIFDRRNRFLGVFEVSEFMRGFELGLREGAEAEAARKREEAKEKSESK